MDVPGLRRPTFSDRQAKGGWRPAKNYHGHRNGKVKVRMAEGYEAFDAALDRWLTKFSTLNISDDSLVIHLD